jgi:hypothetical protein
MGEALATNPEISADCGGGCKPNAVKNAVKNRQKTGGLAADLGRLLSAFLPTRMASLAAGWSAASPGHWIVVSRQ